MTKKERVIRALNHKETDTVPYNISFTAQEYEIVNAYAGNKNYAESVGNHIHACWYEKPREEISGRPGYFKDEFGAIWNCTGADKNIGIIEEPLIPDLESRDYTLPPIDEIQCRESFQDQVSAAADKFIIGSIGFSMFERAWTLCGIENTLMSMLACPEELENLLDDICERNLRILDIMLEYDLDGIYFGDDWGQQKGMIMGPAHWRRFIKPRMKRMYEKAKGAGKFVSQHSCGDILEIFPDLIEIGLDCYQTFQPEIYDIMKVKREYGADLAFWGGISTQRVLSQGTPEEVTRETARTMSIMKKDGGYIAAPTHDVPHDVPPENVAAMVEVFQNQDKYLK